MGHTRDYYADLEISPNADTAEIKKQYRKLALKYHPDRNPGREEEVNSQFLIIQAAHDVLIDTQERAKYDSSRKSGGGRYPTASGVRGNPWSNVSQQYPTPPRRQNASARNPTSGADRWNQRFSAGVPPTARASTAAGSGAETKKNAASAFEKMRNKPQTGAKSQPPPPPPRADYAKQRSEAAFGSRSSRAGRAPTYMPSASGSGDEPSVSNSNYSTRRDPPASYAQEHQKPQHVPMPDPLRQFRDDNFSDPRKSSPYTTHGGEKTNPFDKTNIGRSKSTREPSRYSASGADEIPASGRRPRSTTESGGPAASSPGVETEPPEYSRPRNYAQPEAQTPNKPPTEASTSSPKKPPIFIISDSDDGHEPKSFARSSVDDINTSFTNDTGTEKWEFSAGTHDPGHPGEVQPQPGKDTSRTAQAQPSEPQAESVDGSVREQAFGEQRFYAEGWGGQFGPETFVPPPRTGSSGSPSKTARATTKKPKPNKAFNGDNVTVIDDSSDDDNFTWRGRKTQASETVADSPQAMDIDSPRVDRSASPPPPVNEPRNIPVEPSRPEWRAGDRANAESTPTTPAPKTAPINYSNAVGSEDSEEFKASLADLRSASPLEHEKSGLKSFGEMKDNLPFESKAGGEVPLSEVLHPQPLAFPQAPQAPRLPPTVAVSGLQPNASSWEKYSSEFESYMREWDQFQGKVTDHFATRMSHISQSRGSKGYAFLRRSEDDCLEYFKSVQQDNDVRRRWNAECEEHERRLREFMAFREKMK